MGTESTTDPGYIWWNLGSNNYQQYALPSGNIFTRSLDVGDVNGDGFKDIVITARSNNIKVLFYNPSTPRTFAAPIDVPFEVDNSGELFVLSAYLRTHFHQE